MPPPKEMPGPSTAAYAGPKIELDADDKACCARRASETEVQDLRRLGDRSRRLPGHLITEPAVDLTARLEPFAQQTGIDIPDAQLPPGEHFIQLDLKD